MALNVMSHLRQCAEYIEKARNEENEDGDPLRGAAYYLTAMELIMQWASTHAFTLATERERQYFLFQVRQKVEVYAERVHLLLHVAESVGLLDKPTLPYQMELLPGRASASSSTAAAAVSGNEQQTSTEEERQHENHESESELLWEEPVKPAKNTIPNNNNNNKNNNNNTNDNSMNAGGQDGAETAQQPNNLIHEATSINILSEPFIQPQQNNTSGNTDPVLGIPLKPESAEGKRNHTK